jgi:Fe/S biogenesis protein NfuA
MGIMERELNKVEAGREGIPLGENRDKPVLAITDNAREKIRAVLGSQSPVVDTIRVSASGPGRYSMSLEAEGKPGQDDTVLPYSGFQVFVDPASMRFVDGASLEWVDTYGGGGFQFSAPVVAKPGPKAAPEGPEGERWRAIQQLLDEEINPAVAMHGGQITLMEVDGSRVYVEMGGGCQGCGQAKVTLKSGVERMLFERFPDITEVLDVTDHASGTNPYYAG